MVKRSLLVLSGLLVAGAGYTLAAAVAPSNVAAAAAATAPAAETSTAVDVKNTKCLVTKEDVAGDDQTKLEYKGKIYHFCCSMCVKKFNKDPDSFVKAFEADPAAYGVKK